MAIVTFEKLRRRARFRRAPEPPPFRLTDDDVEIVRQLARFRFLRSTDRAQYSGGNGFRRDKCHR